ncbi:MAG TPA: MFS transporter [Rhodospirillales bacterium]|nr:MFS transporter [Rhodospirillales bacterium]HIL76171.1 MFS transporter [Rhodospirillales bacterium]
MQLIIIVTMVTMMGGSVISPALPVIQQAFIIETSKIGLLMTAFSLPGIISIPIAGIMTDRFGRQKVIVPMLLLYSIAGSLCFFAPNFEVLLLLRFLSGLGAGALATLSLILIGDLFNDKEQKEALGYRTSFGYFSNGILPIFGGFLAVISWNYPFLLFLLGIPISLMAMAVLVNEKIDNQSTIKEYLIEVGRGLSNVRTASLLTIAPTLMMINQGILATFLPIYIGSKFGVSAAIIGLIISTRVIAGSLIAFFVGKLTEIVKEEWLLISSMIVLAITIIFIPFVTSVWFMIGPVMVMGFALGVSFPAFQSLLISEAPKELRAGVMSANGVTNRMGQAAGPIIAGALYATGGFKAVFFGASLFLLAMIIFLTINFRNHISTR